MTSASVTANERRQQFADDVCRGLALTPKQIESQYLYDALGSALFEAICRLPWYRITRGENRLLARQATAIATLLPEPTTMIELGCGSGEKLAMLVQAWHRWGRRVNVHLIDISAAALEQSEQRLGQFEQASVVGHRSTYDEGLRAAAAHRRPGDALLVVFLGSNLGNFDQPAAREFLGEIRGSLAGGDTLLLGLDLVKPEADLLLAYDDPLGVTAAFNKNVLSRVNTELGGDFDLDGFEHRAVWDPEMSRVEMHLVSRRAQDMSIPAAGCRVHFDAGEHIWTESSYKYDPVAAVDMVEEIGFCCREQWIDGDSRFALTLFEAD